jgi:hypothetical protein
LLVEFFVPGIDAAASSRAAVEIAQVTVSAYVLTAGGRVERQEARFPIVTALDAGGSGSRK